MDSSNELNVTVSQLHAAARTISNLAERLEEMVATLDTGSTELFETWSGGNAVARFKHDLENWMDQAESHRERLTTLSDSLSAAAHSYTTQEENVQKSIQDVGLNI